MGSSNPTINPTLPRPPANPVPKCHIHTFLNTSRGGDALSEPPFLRVILHFWYESTCGQQSTWAGRGLSVNSTKTTFSSLGVLMTIAVNKLWVWLILGFFGEVGMSSSYLLLSAHPYPHFIQFLSQFQKQCRIRSAHEGGERRGEINLEHPREKGVWQAWNSWISPPWVGFQSLVVPSPPP